MKLTTKQMRNNVDLWMGTAGPTILKHKTLCFTDKDEYVLKEFKRKNLLLSQPKTGPELCIEKNTYKLLYELRKRHFQMYLSEKGDTMTCFNFLGGIKDGVLSAIVPIKHKKGCMFFSPVTPENFLEPMYELQINGYIPKVLVRFTLFTVNGDTDSRINEISFKGNNQEMIILSFGFHGARAESSKGSMRIVVK